MKVFGLAGPSGIGKTTVIENVIPLFSAMGLSVSVIKHTHHDFDVDKPGKDSWRQRQHLALAPQVSAIAPGTSSLRRNASLGKQALVLYDFGEAHCGAWT